MYLGQINRVDEGESGQGAGDDGKGDEDDERSFTGKFEAGPGRIIAKPMRPAKAAAFDRLGWDYSQRLRASRAFLKRARAKNAVCLERSTERKFTVPSSQFTVFPLSRRSLVHSSPVAASGRDKSL
jgi:hypothetical protein